MTHDLIVVGGGTAGLVSAAGASSMGARVAIVEADRLGGDCLWHGCVPTKALVRSARAAADTRRFSRLGVSIDAISVDPSSALVRMREAVNAVAVHDDPQRFRDMGIDVLLGEPATFLSPTRVQVGSRTLHAPRTIVATGSHTYVPDVPGLRSTGYLTHVDLLERRTWPSSMVVVGAGPIGCEFAQIAARLGCEVTLIGSSELPLPREEPEVSRRLLEQLRRDGVKVHLDARMSVTRLDGGISVVGAETPTGSGVEARGDEILLATGRRPSVEGLRLDRAGVVCGPRGITVDRYLRTTNPHVFAAGDVTGRHLFTHIADQQAKIALANALFPIRRALDERVTPWVTFTDPEVARVGLTEAEARRTHDDVKVYRYDLADLDRAICDDSADGLVKLVTTKRGAILGGHIIGADVGAMLAEVVLAMQHGLSIQKLSTTPHVYPTTSEGVKRAADGYYREKLFDGPGLKVLSMWFDTRRRLRRSR